MKTGERFWNRLQGKTICTMWGVWYTLEEWRIECERVKTLHIELKKQTPFIHPEADHDSESNSANETFTT